MYININTECIKVWKRNSNISKANTFEKNISDKSKIIGFKKIYSLITLPRPSPKLGSHQLFKIKSPIFHYIFL